MDQPGVRIERDSLGEVRVPADALWGAQTERARQNFQVGERRLPPPFLRALARIKAACARANAELGQLEPGLAEAIAAAADEVASGAHAEQFPLPVLQTGSGTSSNMNMNEVLARLAGRRLGDEGRVHPNDHVNRGQSSNDVIPSAIHVAAALELSRQLLPAAEHLERTLLAKAHEVQDVVKTGRTHLMDAVPLRMSQEVGAWAWQVREARQRLEGCLPRLQLLALGGTAVGTGLNAHPELGQRAAARLAQATGILFAPAPDRFARIGAQDAALELSGQLRGLAAVLLKLSDDLRWLNAGPLGGPGEIALPALQPGSSIMPGKVNPVIPEAAAMAAVLVFGHDAALTHAAQAARFQLHTMLPLVADLVLESIQLLAGACRSLADQAVAGFLVRRERIAAALARNPILATALAPEIGYDAAAEVAKRAAREERPVLDVALEMTGLSEARLRELLDSARLADGGVTSG